MVETRARVRCKQKRERESSHKSLTQSVLLTRPLSDDDAPVERHESRSNAPQLPPILEFSRFRRKRGALIVRHAADTFPTTTPLFSSFEQRASSPRCWSNVNKVFGACAVAGSFAANHTGLSAHATSIPQREYTISLFPSLFPLPFSSSLARPTPGTPDAVHLALGLVHAHVSHPTLAFFSSFVERKNAAPHASSDAPRRVTVREVGPLLRATSPRDPCRCNGDATVMGVAAREATPMHDGEARSIP